MLLNWPRYPYQNASRDRTLVNIQSVIIRRIQSVQFAGRLPGWTHASNRRKRDCIHPIILPSLERDAHFQSRRPAFGAANNMNLDASSNSQAVSQKHVAEQPDTRVLGKRQKGNHEEGWCVLNASR